jgi:putative ABC transport system ATP-binding protein
MPEARSPQPAPAARGALIEMRAVDKVYHTPAGDFWALKHIDIDIYPGEFIGVLGKSGSGKSTLGNMITGIDHPSRGVVKVGGANIHAMPEGRVSVWRGKNLGIVFQFFQLLPMLTALENVLVPMDFAGAGSLREREKRALELLALVGLEDAADRMPDELSGGQQQSVAIARALANDPPLILADEPTGNLDTQTAESVIQVLEHLVGQGKTIVMVTHDVALARRTSRTLLLADGELVHPALPAAFPRAQHRALLDLTHRARDCALGCESGPLPLAQPALRLVTAGAGLLLGPQDHAPRELRAGAVLLPSSDGPPAVLTALPGAPLTWVEVDAAALAEIAARHPSLAEALAHLETPGPGAGGLPS